MFYSLVPIAALIVTFVLNYDFLLPIKSIYKSKAAKAYRLFVNSICLFFITDLIWGIFDDHGMNDANMIDTSFYFIAMALSVLTWTRFVVKYLQDRSKLFNNILLIVGWVFFVSTFVIVIVNFFHPIMFTYNANEYVPKYARYVYLGIQIVLFALVAIYSLIVAVRVKETSSKIKYSSIAVFSLVMILMTTAQVYNPDKPMYAFGLLVGVAFIHVFLVSTRKREYLQEISEGKEREKKQNAELIATKELVYIDPLTGVKNKHAYVEVEEHFDILIREKKIKQFAVVIFDLNNLKVINDNYGHQTGDAYIKKSCEIISKFFPESDVYRFGGDEFVVVLENGDYEARRQKLKEFENLMEKNIGTKEPIVASGSSDFVLDKDNTFRAVFIRADERMYLRKKILKEMAE